jgi:hypothetical protein
MTIRKRTAEVTADAYGNASVDVSTSTTAPTRFAALVGVEVPSEGNTNTKRTHIDVYEVNDYDVDDATADTYGTLLFHLFGARTDTLYQPRVETHKASVNQAASPGEASQLTAEENSLLRFRTARLRVDVTGATPASTFDVELFIETAGDQRF